VLILAAGTFDNDFPWLTVIMRWVHIISACLAIGAPFFMRYIIMPVAKKNLGDEAAEDLRQKIMGRWKFFVHLLIAAFLVTGGYTFWINMPTKADNWPATARIAYHAIFGIKVILALVIFFIASALVGRSAAFEKIRKRHKLWATFMILLAFAVVLCGNVLRQLHIMNKNAAPVSTTLPAAP
jgi:uncharacterized membrane protein